MLIVDCPLCDRAAPFEAEAGALECDACGVRLEVGPGRAAVSAAAA